MADNTDNPQLDNFSIQDTMNMGAGSAELLNDLLAPETAGGDPDGLEPIIKDVIEPAPAAVAPAAAAKPEPNKPGEPAKPEEKPDSSIKDFLASDGEGGEPTADPDPDPDPGAQDAAQEGAQESEGDPNGEGGTQFAALANDLIDLGVFTQEEGAEPLNIKTPEEFLNKFQEEKRKGSIEMVDNFIGQFGEDYQKAFESIFVKGVEPKEYFTSFNKAQDFAAMDLTQEVNQKAVLTQALTDQGFEGEDIGLEIERLSNYGDLETVAQRHHKVLVKREASKMQQMEQDAQAKIQHTQSVKNQYIDNVQNIIKDKVKEKGFDGIPLNPKMANELHDFLLVDKYKTPTGETLTDFDRTILELKRPENHAQKVKLGLLLKLLEKDPTLSTIQKAGITKKTNTMFSQVVKQNNESPSRKTNVKRGAAPRWFQ